VQFRMTAPIFMTVAAHRLSRVLLYDLASSLAQEFAQDALPFSLDEVDEAFRLMHHGGQCRVVRYQEELNHLGVVFRAFSGGRTLGGAIWTISRLTEKIAYAHDASPLSEQSLPQCALSMSSSSASTALEGLTLLVLGGHAIRPAPLLAFPPLAASAEQLATLSSLAIDAAKGGAGDASPPREESLAASIAQVWRRSGNVLVAIDSTARLPELALQLDSSVALSGVPGWIAVLSPVAPVLFRYASSLRDWSNARPGEDPFSFGRVIAATSAARLAELEPPGCVLTASSSLESGFAKSLLPVWAGDSRNAVILTHPPPAGSLASKLLLGESLRRVAGRDATLSDQVRRVYSTLTGDSVAPGNVALPAAPAGGESEEPAPVTYSPAVEVRGSTVVARFQERFKRRLEGEELEDWERTQAMRQASRARQIQEMARRKAVDEQNRKLLDSSSSSSQAAPTPSVASTNSSQIEAARVRLGLPSLPGGAMHSLLGSQSSATALVAALLNGSPAIATYGGKPPPGEWDQFGQVVDWSALRGSEKQEDGGEAGRVASSSSAAGAQETLEGAAALEDRLAKVDDWGVVRLASDPDAELPEVTTEKAQTVQVLCQLGYLDLTGRVAQSAIAHLAARCNPRAIAVITGQETPESDSLHEFAAAFEDDARPLKAVRVGASASLGSGSALRSMRLSAELFTRLHFAPAGGMEVAYIQAQCGEAASDAADEQIELVAPPRLAQSAASASGSSASVQRVKAREEDEDDDVMERGLHAGSFDSVLAFPSEARQAHLLHDGPITLRGVHKALARSGLSNQLAPGLVQTAEVRVFRRTDGSLTLQGTAGTDWDMAHAAIRGMGAFA
jgi:Cft2 family RNA processing exonuclease